jgi:hypothetical protein
MYEIFIFATRIVEVVFDKSTLQFRICLRNFFFHDATAPGGPGLPHYRGFTFKLRHTTLGRTTLDEWPARRRGNTQQSQETAIHAPAEFEPTTPASGRRPTSYPAWPLGFAFTQRH